MPPGNPEAYDYETLLNEIYGGEPAGGEADGLGVGGVLGTTALLGGGLYAARNTRPVQAAGKLAGRLGGSLPDGLASRVGNTVRQAAGRLVPKPGFLSARWVSPYAAAGPAAVAGAAGAGVLGGGRAGTALYDNVEPYAQAVDAVAGAATDDTPGDAASIGSEWLGRVGGLFTGNFDQALAGTPLSPYDDYEESLLGSSPGGTVERFVTGRQPAEAGAPALAAEAPVTGAGSPVAELPEQDDLGRILGMLEDRAVGVEQDYQARVNELRGLYQLAETEEERAQLQYALGTLEAQRAAGHEVIQNAYGQAMADSGARAQSVRDAAARQAGEVGANFGQAAADIGGIVTDAQGQYADSGLGVGATDVSGNVTDWIPMVEGEGARQRALTQQLGQISADDIEFLTAALGGERAAQQGDLERAALMYGADATMAHNARVQDRIAAERMALAGQIGQTQQFYDSRRYDLDDTAIQLGLDVYGQQLAAGAGVDQPIIPDDPQAAYIAGLDMIGQYGQAALPFIMENGLIPPQDLAIILESMGAMAPAQGQ